MDFHPKRMTIIFIPIFKRKVVDHVIKVVLTKEEALKEEKIVT